MVIFCYYKIKKYADFHVWHPAMKLLWMQININVIFDYHTSCSKIENVRQRVVFQKKNDDGHSGNDDINMQSGTKGWTQTFLTQIGLIENRALQRKSYQYCFLQDYIP